MADQHWALLDGAGAIVAQIITDGRSPNAEGSNPDGMTEVAVDRQGDLAIEELVDGAWTLRLDALRASRKAEAEAYRDAQVSGGCTTPAGRVDSDPASRDLISGSALMASIAKGAGAPFSITWRLADNSDAVLDADGMIGMGVAVGAHVSACYEASFAVKDAIDHAVDAAAIEAVDVEAGYPGL